MMEPEEQSLDSSGSGLPKKLLIRKSSHYKAVYQQGKRLRGQHFSLIFAANNLGYNRLGISIHGVKKAVERNRRKRLIREFFRHNKNFLPPGLDIIFAVRRQFQPRHPAEISARVDLATRTSRSASPARVDIRP